MKRVNREITIFNLSMMDVISGAMGAFLILVVILSRHYSSEVINTQRILDLQKELVEATGNLTDVSELVTGDTMDTDMIERSLQSAKANVERSKAHVAELYEELQEANATIEQQDEEIEALNDELERHKQFFVMAKWECEQSTSVGMYLWTSGETRAREGRASRPMPEFDPSRHQGAFFSNTLYQGLANTDVGMEVWTNSYSDVDRRGKLYFRISTPESPLTTCSVRSWLVTPEETQALGTVRLTPDQPWTYAGELSIDEERVVSFRTADDNERAQEHSRVGG